MDISSTCCATLGYQSETHMPLCPYCLKLRFEPSKVLLLVPMAVMGLPEEAGMGWPASLFSSARRAVDASTSKMPPQQPDRLLDLFNEAFDFSAHGFSNLRRRPLLVMLRRM